MSIIEKIPAGITDEHRAAAAIIDRRMKLERAIYGAATLGIAIGPQMEGLWPAHVGAAAITIGAAARLWRKAGENSKDHKEGKAEKSGNDRLSLITACQRTIPALTGAGLYLLNLLAPFPTWVEVIADPIAWGGLMAWMTPRARATALAVDLPQLPQLLQPQTLAIAGAASPEPATLEEWAAQVWAAGNLAPGTILINVRRYQDDLPDFRATVVAPRGKAVPDIPRRAIAALFKVPESEEVVALSPIPGADPGQMQLTITPNIKSKKQRARIHEQPEEAWNRFVKAPGKAAPGVELVRYRREERRTVLLVEAPEGKTIRLPHAELCSALRVKEKSCLVIETDGIGSGVISVYHTNPLMNVRKPTVEDLTMDDKGRIAIGIRHDGKPCKVRLWDPDLGALRGITAGATGAGKSVLQLLLLVGEKRSGVVSWVGDIQGGKSLPEAEGNVDWFAKGEYETLAMLMAAHAVMKYREKASRDRADFALNDPWPLLDITLDEINRLLSHPDEKIKKLAAQLIADIQKTGRKVGVGIRLAVQSLHLKDLGDEEAIRQQGKAGMVALMRTLSSSTKDMGLDGISPPGFQMENIPARIYEDGQIEALFDGKEDDDGQSTAGMAYIFNDGRAEFMRTFYAKKVNGRYTDLMALFGDEPPITIMPDEAAATDLYTLRDNPEALESTVEVLLASDVNAFTNGAAAAVAPTASSGQARPAKKLTLRDRIKDLLAGGPMTIQDIRAELGVGKDGGPARGSVNNAMTQLKDEGAVQDIGGGIYELLEESELVGEDSP